MILWLVRATVLPTIINLIMRRYSVNEIEALSMFYKSITGANYADDETGLYSQYALYIFNLFNNEFVNESIT